MRFLIIILIFLFLNVLDAEEKKEEKKELSLKLSLAEFSLDELKLTTRYIDFYEQHENSKIQNNVTIGIKVDLNGAFQIVSVAQTGMAYNQPWETIDVVEGKDNGYVNTLSLRNLYIQTKIEDYLIQVGALKTENGLFDTTGLAKFGWVDGARVVVPTRLGKIQITGGSLNDPKEPNVFKREFEFNYFEITLTKKLFDSLTVAAKVGEFENLKAKNSERIAFAGFAAKLDIKLTTKRILTLVTEYVRDENNAYKYSIGFKADLLRLITGKHKGIKISANYIYMTNDFSALGSTYSQGIYSKAGETCAVTLSGPVPYICKKIPLRWIAQLRYTEEEKDRNYFLGLSFRF